MTRMKKYTAIFFVILSLWFGFNLLSGLVAEVPTAQAAEASEQVKITLPDGSRYVGEIKDGKPHGKGTLTYPDRRKYSGEFLEGVKNGQGTFIWPNGEKHIGQYQNDKANGYGIHSWPNGDVLTGNFKDDQAEGKCTYQWQNGQKYVGEFRAGKIHGVGVLTRKDGKEYNVVYRDNQYIGDFTVVNPGDIGLGKQEWLDKTVRFSNKYSYTMLYANLTEPHPGLRAGDLYGKQYTVKRLIRRSNGLSEEYLWQLESASGETVWYKDSHYGDFLRYQSKAADTRPFLFRQEIDAPPGYVAVPAGEIYTYKAGWIGQSITFKTNKPSGFVEIIQDNSSTVTAEELMQCKLVVTALYKETSTPYRPKYYWRLQDEVTGRVVWFYDDHYSWSSQGSPSSLPDNRPFLVASEIKANNSRIDEFKAWIGRTVWADINKSYYLERLKIGHLEKLVVADVRVDPEITEVSYHFRRADGSIVTWTYRFLKYLGKSESSEKVIAKVAFLENPYEKYPDWPEEVWDLIRQQRVQIGWGKEKCIMSWGRPARINKTTGSWGVHEQWVYGDHNYLYFENGVLSSIQS